MEIGATKNLSAPQDAQIIWRYMDLPRFVSLLHTSSLHLTRLDHFDDPWEGILPKSMTEFLRRGLAPNASPEEFKELDKRVQCFNYVSCWHMNDHESAALWDLYAKPAGLAIRSTVGALKQSLIEREKFHVVAVEYVDFEGLRFNSNKLDYYVAALYKRLSFKHENELRVIDTYDWWEQDRPGYRSARVDLRQLVHEVRIAPSSPEWFAIAAQEVSKRFGQTFVFGNSDLYSPRVY